MEIYQTMSVFVLDRGGFILFFSDISVKLMSEKNIYIINFEMKARKINY